MCRATKLGDILFFSPLSVSFLTPLMDIYLIRHGETVDNVANLYAGVRDSALTNHGTEQARCLGGHLAKTGVRVSCLFSSPLSRALKTAQKIQDAQKSMLKGDEQFSAEDLDITVAEELIEQDFGSYEGKHFSARSNAVRSQNDGRRVRLQDQPGFVDVESKESMAKRADAFLDRHIAPFFDSSTTDKRRVIVIVSHGILLTHLWRRLLRRLPQRSITSQEVISRTLEHLGGWSNTGYLHLSFSRKSKVPDDSKEREDRHTTLLNQTDEKTIVGNLKPGIGEPSASQPLLQDWSLNIVSIDNREHLIGLKRQRGGIGSLAHDEGQRKLQSFFKKQRTV